MAQNTLDLQQFCLAAWPRANWKTTSNPSGTVPIPKLTPDTALCFWLGGAQDGPAPTAAAPAIPHFIGFSANPANPFDFGASRTPALLEFDKNRLNSSPTGNILVGGNSKSGLANGNTTNLVYYNLYQYYPPNSKDMTSGTYMPYVYYKAVPVPSGSPDTVYTIAANQNAQQAWSWQETNLKTALPYYDSTAAIAKTFVNPQSYQLLCPGLDGIYGNTGGNPPLYPAGTNYDQNNGIDDMTNFTQAATVGNDTK